MRPTVIPTPLPDVYLVEVVVFGDERGFFIEPWNSREFAEAGLALTFKQEGHSRSGANVLRGLHYQDMTEPMGKLVRCTVGAILDVAVDLRVGSPTLGKHVSVELTASNKRQLYVPPGFAHGFATLSDVAEVQYKQTGFYTPSSEGAIAWDDPDVGIAWPYRDPVLSKKDVAAPTLKQYLENPAFRYGETPFQ